MQISDHIQDLITANKAKPNGEWRNKVHSHLKDALACAKIDEAQYQINPPIMNLNPECNCPAGARLLTCPIHGLKP